MKISIKEVVEFAKLGLRKLSLLRNAKSNSDYVRAKKELREEKKNESK